MDEFEYSKHALDMFIERGIKEIWVVETINSPDFNEFVSNEELHYIKQIKEFGNRYLRVVVNLYTKPKKIITFFFDRKIKNKL